MVQLEYGTVISNKMCVGLIIAPANRRGLGGRGAGTGGTGGTEHFVGVLADSLYYRQRGILAADSVEWLQMVPFNKVFRHVRPNRDLRFQQPRSCRKDVAPGERGLVLRAQRSPRFQEPQRSATSKWLTISPDSTESQPANPAFAVPPAIGSSHRLGCDSAD